MQLTKQEIIDIKKATRNSSMEPWSDSVAFAENIQAALLKKLQSELEQATLYRWLRDRPYKYKFSLPSQNAFVMDQRASRLYAVARLDGDQLDATLKQEILDDMINYLGYEQEVEGDERFSDFDWRFSDARCNELEQKAMKELGYDTNQSDPSV